MKFAVAALCGVASAVQFGPGGWGMPMMGYGAPRPQGPMMGYGGGHHNHAPMMGHGAPHPHSHMQGYGGHAPYGAMPGYGQQRGGARNMPIPARPNPNMAMVNRLMGKEAEVNEVQEVDEVEVVETTEPVAPVKPVKPVEDVNDSCSKCNAEVTMPTISLKKIQMHSQPSYMKKRQTTSTYTPKVSDAMSAWRKSRFAPKVVEPVVVEAAVVEPVVVEEVVEPVVEVIAEPVVEEIIEEVYVDDDDGGEVIFEMDVVDTYTPDGVVHEEKIVTNQAPVVENHKRGLKPRKPTPVQGNLYNRKEQIQAVPPNHGSGLIPQGGNPFAYRQNPYSLGRKNLSAPHPFNAPQPQGYGYGPRPGPWGMPPQMPQMGMPYGPQMPQMGYGQPMQQMPYGPQMGGMPYAPPRPMPYGY